MAEGSLESRRDKLQREYRDALPARRDDLERCWHGWQSGGERDMLITAVHKLAGSAMLYGFKEIGECAARVENALHNGAEVGDEVTEQHYSALIASFDAAASRIGDAQAAVADSARPGRAGPGISKQRFLFVSPENESIDALVGQLTTRGAQALRIRHSDIDSIELDTVPGLVLIDADALEDAVLTVVLQRLRTLTSDASLIGVFSAQDSFESRVAAVHAGADVFLLTPLTTESVFEAVTTAIIDESDIPGRVLVVDDDVDQARHLRAVLEESGFEVETVSDIAVLLAAMFEFRPELIIMDLHMPRYDGIDVTRVLRQHESFFDLPIVFFSGDLRTQARVRAAEAGADAYLTKSTDDGYLARLVRSRISLRRKTSLAVSRDALTGLLNRMALDERLVYELERAQRERQDFCIALIDMDRFKEINDQYGHLVGDEAIKHVASLLIMELRSLDVAGRFGGDEMLIFMPSTDRSGGEVVLNRIVGRLAETPLVAGGANRSIEVSVGLLHAVVERGVAIESLLAGLLEQADALLYEAKRDGRNKVKAAEFVLEEDA